MPSWRLTASSPEIHIRAASLFSLASSFSSPFRSASVSPLCILDPLAIAVMGFVIQDHYVLQAHEVFGDAADHFALGFEGVHLLSAPAFDGLPRALRDIH